MRETLDIHDGIDFAPKLAASLYEAVHDIAVDDRDGAAAIYVKVDGAIVHGFTVVKETLTDGSFVYNIELLAN